MQFQLCHKRHNIVRKETTRQNYIYCNTLMGTGSKDWYLGELRQHKDYPDLRISYTCLYRSISVVMEPIMQWQRMTTQKINQDTS
jgi:hypothetical protein